MRRFLFILPAVAILVVLAFTFCTARVPTGYTGIVTTFGKVEDGTLEAGFHIKSPVQKVIMMDNREQRETFSTQAFSSDIQQVQIVGSINYNINKQTAMTLYKEVGTAYSSTLITPRLFEHTKSVFSLYSAEDLVANRSNLSTSIRAALANELSAYGINVVSISIEDIDFSDAFTDAVEAKQVAEQTKLKVETEQAQQISIEKADAERRRISAEAEASAARTKADAEAYALTVQAAAEAEANELIAGSLTTDLLEYWKIERWTGEVPQVQLGTDAYPIIDITPSMGD